MKGWEFTDTHQPLRFVEKPDPEVKPGYVLLKTKACGLCHSDISALELDSWRPMFNAPVILGHEVSGEIIAIGEGVEGWNIGDAVAVCPVGAKDHSIIGYTHDGGYGTMCQAQAELLVKLPENVSYMQGAAATDAGQTSYNAVFAVGGAKPGMKVGIIGVGGLGQFAVRMAVIKGCEVYAATLKKEDQEMALALGAKGASGSMLDFKDVGLDVIVDFAGVGTTTSDAIDSIKFGGTIVVVGMAKNYSTICTYNFITKGATLVSSMGPHKVKISYVDQMKDVIDMMASGQLDPLLQPISFEEIPEGLEKLAKGDVNGRLIAVYD